MSSRPPIKDPEVLRYVQELEDRLKNFESETTTARSYIALKKFIDEMNELIIEGDFKGENEIEDEKEDKNKPKKFRRKTLTDKLIERWFDYMDNIDKYNDKLETLSKKVSPKILEEAKRQSAGILESAVRESGG